MPDVADDAGKAASTTDTATEIEQRTASVGEVAKWVSGGLGAIGVTFAAGAQLSSLGAVTEPWRLVVAVVAILVGLGATALAISKTIDILLPERLNLTAVGALPSSDPVTRYVASNADELLEGTASSVGGDSGFALLYRDAIRQRTAAYEAANGEPDDSPRKSGLTAAARGMDARVLYLNELANKVVATANYQRLRDNVPRWRGWLLGSGFFVAISIALFAYAANPPKTDVGLDLRGASLVAADLSNRNLKGADLVGADLTRANLRNAILEGAKLERVTWKATICPDGTMSDAAGGTCAGHLK